MKYKTNYGEWKHPEIELNIVISGNNKTEIDRIIGEIDEYLTSRPTNQLMLSETSSTDSNLGSSRILRRSRIYTRR